jgi:hypothetical protein
LASPTTNFRWTHPDVGDAGTGYATQLVSCYQEIDTDFAVEHDGTAGHEGHHKDVTYNSMTADAATSICKKGTTTVLQFVPADRDGDGDMNSYGDGTNWNKQKGAATGTINWYSNFGVPAAAKAVQLRAYLTPTADPSLNTAQAAFHIKANSDTDDWSMSVYLSGATLLAGGALDGVSAMGIVPVDADGTSYYQVVAPYASGTIGVYLYVTGYFI